MTGEYLLNFISGRINPCGYQDLPHRMAQHYRTLHFLRPDQTWASPLLEKYSDFLLPLTIEIKLKSVDPIVTCMINAHRCPQKMLGSASGSGMLKMNILEATISDLRMGLWSNAEAW